ncbi:MAG: hypothetical protein ABW223_01925 [Rariglobus sp.]
MKNLIPHTLRSLLVLAVLGAVTTLRAEGDEKKVPAAVLKKYDTNNDGVLDEKEKAVAEADKAKKKADTEAKRLEKYDANKDGKIDQKELEAEKADRAAKKADAEKRKAEKEKKKAESTN